jgi:transposase
MPRPIKLPNDFYNHDYVELSKKEYNAKNKIRLLAMANIKDGMSLQQTGKVLKTPWKTVQGWLFSFRKNGLSGLYVKTTKYKPAKITKEIRDWISAFMKNLYSNSVGGSLTGSQLHTLVKQYFDIECCLQTIYNTLHSLDLSWIGCRSKHPKSDKEVQELYKKTLQVMSKN